MVVRRRFRRFLLPFLLYCGAGAAVAFFIAEANNGNRGIETRNARLEQIARLQAELTELRGERQRIEHRNSMLISESLDPDLLEERARAILGRGFANDVVVMAVD